MGTAVVFNAAAYTAVDKAENEQDNAFAINATALKYIAQACNKSASLLVHYSTDYVFDGSGEMARNEQAPANPINVYGQSKLAGEVEVLNSCCKALIFRTSWVYGVHGKNFVKTILRLAKTKQSLNVVCDQIGTPTAADFIADVSADIALRVLNGDKSLLGIYNLIPNGETNWCEFARWIVKNAKTLGVQLTLEPEKIFSIPSKDYPTAALRPLNSRLDNAKLRTYFHTSSIKDWQFYAQRVLMELSGQ